jgi:hypothetical protein
MTRNHYGLRALGETVAHLTGPILGRRGLVRGALIGDWTTIVGERLADETVPERVTYPPKRSTEGTLHLRVGSGGLALELQHSEPILIDRINTCFGYRAVARVKLIQGPLPVRRSPPNPRQRPLTAAEEEMLHAHLQGITDAELRRILHALGRAVIGREDDASRA